MPLIKYVERRFTDSSLDMIDKANAIINEYTKDGYDLTLRQLYYQFVARDLIKNTMKEYKRMGSIINDARLAGLIDWDAIVDRTRNLRALPHWSTPRDIVLGASQQFRVDKWANQEYRPEVWIEKDALIGVIAPVCNELDVPYFSCRGYTSQSEMWASAMRLQQYRQNDQKPLIIHLGDHDPSGLDMTNDMIKRLDMFLGDSDGALERIALNKDQVIKYRPPHNPAKQTDARFKKYEKKHGRKSWELDALDPKILRKMITRAIMSVRDDGAWARAVILEARGRKKLVKIAKHKSLAR